MTQARSKSDLVPYRASATLPGEGGRIEASDLLAFGERLVREAVRATTGAPVVFAGVSLHMLGTGRSNSVVGEAFPLTRTGTPVWRVTIADTVGQPLADMTLTLSSDPAVAAERTADVVAMPPVSPVDPDSRRAQIARAARDVFAEKGFAAATMREVAAAAKMHVPTMYQYFRSKEEILELVYAWTISQAVEEMKPVLESPGAAADKIEPIVRQLHDVNLKLRRGTLVMNRETRSLSPQARERVLGHYATMVRRLGEVIAEGQADGAFRSMDPQLAAVFVDALADLWVLRPFAVGHIDMDDYAAELVAFVHGALMRHPNDESGETGRLQPPSED